VNKNNWDQLEQGVLRFAIGYHNACHTFCTFRKLLSPNALRWMTNKFTTEPKLRSENLKEINCFCIINVFI
jgi:hypothetical protein